MYNHKRPLLIFIGSRRAGRMLHQQRLIERDSHLYAPVKTVTTRPEAKPGDETWYLCLPSSEVAKYSTDDMLTFFQEGEALYFILKDEVDRVRQRGLVALVGMTPEGFERLESRLPDNRSLAYLALLLQPADPDDFYETLVREHGLDHESAEEETDRAVRLSTIPPARVSRDSVLPVPVTGTDDDIRVVDQALASIFTPP